MIRGGFRGKRTPLAPIYTNFEGERASKKTRFFCQNYSKSAQKFCQNRGKTVLWESSKNQFGRPKKVKIFEFFLKIRPLRENPRSAPVYDLKNIYSQRMIKIFKVSLFLVAQFSATIV